MTDRSPRAARRPRLALFAGILLGLFYLVAVARVIHVDGAGARSWWRRRPIAPLAYVVVSAALGALFVPGPILAAGSGVLFGPLLDTFVTLPAFSAGAQAEERPGAAGCRSRPSPRCTDRTARIVGGGRSALRPRHLGCAGLVHLRGVRSSVVADGRWVVHRVGATGVRLHRAGRVDHQPVVAAGLLGDRGVVRDRHHRGVRRAALVPEVACAPAPAVRPGSAHDR
ncbi:hypothetical protein J113_16000 [Mycobacterium tuberculosis CAS/NITR204]|uniref:Transmembrane protein n=1 Tax=Mycobacterium tuberculosis CAS/NITR204 TaxID=1310114 RepID=R4MJV8_MYCTX|nr:hypothetical protein J113_16000 [Mycobacterium tuberculosis CAS/NITR204]